MAGIRQRGSLDEVVAVPLANCGVEVGEERIGEGDERDAAVDGAIEVAATADRGEEFGVGSLERLEAGRCRKLRVALASTVAALGLGGSGSP